ncbi:unnamed protein product [Cylindrotheca closterium]|uniref:Uncharacterized protein n=1 Tax=Cylindrotheca closterium TaxID=2856 RepID=A0AAD2GD31_9STRA|nr:unnamed protein product [Cylindrotheca closterium]
MSTTYEKLMEQLPSTAVIDAVASVSGDKVVASDVATRAGVSLSQAKKDLTALASLSRGDISVSSDGELIYEFPSNLKGVLSSNSAKYQALQVFEKAWPTVFWGIRVSFGVALLASVVLIFSTLLVINSSSSSDDDNRRRDNRGFGGGGFGGGMNIWWGPSPFDIFYYRPYGYYGYYGDRSDAKDPEEMGFLESTFSYIFGDGNPNQGLEERRLGLAAQMIRQNNGAVTAEQLAPYCDAPDPSDSKSSYVEESFVLPVVTQLNGEPRVTDDGDIVYVFPELQISALSSEVVPRTSETALVLKRAGLPPSATAREIRNLLNMSRISTTGALEKDDLIRLLKEALPPMTMEEEEELMPQDPGLLLERQYKFSLAPDLNKVLAGGLGIVNLGGALYLGRIFSEYAMYGVRLPSFLGLTQSIYPLLLGYAVLFNVIPLARNFWIKSENKKIGERNRARRKWNERLKSKAGNIGRKLKSAAKFATNRRQLNANDVIFDTKESAAEMEKSKNQLDLDDFDKLLDGDGSFQ